MLLFAWQHQDITWNNVGLALDRSYGIDLRTVSRDMHKISTPNMSLEITNSKLQRHLPGANE